MSATTNSRTISLLLLREAVERFRLAWAFASWFFLLKAQGAAADRSIRTPTSVATASTSQHMRHAEEQPLIRVPRQQAKQQTTAGADELAGQTHKRLHERRELQAQQPMLLGAVLFLPAARRLGQAQGEPRFQIPGQRDHHHVVPLTFQTVHRRLQRMAAAVQLG